MESLRVTKEIRFSIIIPAYNAERTLSSCLAAVTDQSVSKKDYEVIVVDDGSTDSTSNIAKGFNVKYIFQANQGPAAARNRGVHSAEGNIVLFTDADCVSHWNWIEEMVKPFGNPDVVGVKGAYRTKQKELASRFAQAEFEDRYDLLQKNPSIDMIDTYSAAFKKKVFLNMGGFDESFPVANNEDTDFSYRLAFEGYELVFNPKAIVYHTHPNTFRGYLRLKFWRGYWRMVVYRRYSDKAVKDSYTPAVIKIQTLLMAFSFLCFPFTLVTPGFFFMALSLWGIIILSSLSFSLKTFKNDKPVGLIVPGVVLLRSIVFAIGSLLGVAGVMSTFKCRIKA